MPQESPIALALGEKLGEVVVAGLVIIKALKKQPGFDVAMFESHIREVLADSSRPEDSLVRIILEETLKH